LQDSKGAKLIIKRQILFLAIGNVLLNFFASAGKLQQSVKLKPVFAVDTTVKKGSNQNNQIVK
jgi:hypothetical protein